MLSFAGVWPQVVSSKALHFVYEIIFRSVIICTLILLIGEVLAHMIVNINTPNFRMMVVYFFCAIMTALYKYIQLSLRNQKVAKLISDYFNDDWMNTKDEVEENIVKIFYFKIRLFYNYQIYTIYIYIRVILKMFARWFM